MHPEPELKRAGSQSAGTGGNSGKGEDLADFLCSF